MSRHAPPSERRRAATILVGLAALTAMLALVIAVPIVLLIAWHTLGPPIPSPHDLTGPDDGTVFVRTLCLIGWLAWASFTWAGLAEFLAQWRGWHLPAIGWQRQLAADLIAAVIVVFASPSIVSSVAAPVAVPAATAVHAPAGSGMEARTQERTSRQADRPSYVEHHVQAGEQMPALAERYLGDKYRWKAIAAATYGLGQPDGRTLRPGDTRIYPGWTVRIPATDAVASTVFASSMVAARPDLAPAAGPAPVSIEYQARDGDWVWYIAERFLGDPDRYPDIAALNPQLARKYGNAFPDHIEPGDILRLPADARDRGSRTHAAGTASETSAGPTIPDTPTPDPGAVAPPGAHPSPKSTATPPGPAPSSTASPSATSPTSGTDLTTDPPSAAAQTSASSPGPSRTEPSTHVGPQTSEPAHQDPATDLPGVDLGAHGWVGADLAAAVAAAAALVWIHRRRRYRPRRPSSAVRLDPDLAPLPPAVATLHGSRSPAITEDDMDDPEPQIRIAATVTHASLGTNDAGRTVHLSDLPALGVGWTGPGARDAARALIASILSAGGPWTPAAEATLIITRQTLADLLPGAETIGLDPLRLQTADTLDQALDELERQLLRRARLAADPYPGVSGIDAPDAGEPTLPPMVLLAAAPTGAAATRLAAILTVGSRLAITALLLGDWPIGDTWHVHSDGTTTPDQDAPDRRRLNVLDEATAVQILHTIRQAHPDDLDPEPEQAVPPLSARIVARAAHALTVPGPDQVPGRLQPSLGVAGRLNGAASATSPRLHLVVLGRPRARTAGSEPADLRIRRSDGVQLLVQFAVEPHGATSDELMALLWPETRPQYSRRRFHTTISELRHTLTDALGADPIARTEDRYRLDPAMVDVDLWNLHAAVDQAATAVEPAHHHAALQEVIRRYTGPVAEGHTWLWLDPYRETVRRHVLDAYTALAETEPDPRTALTLVQDAIRVDPYNEHLYQQAMHLHARLGSSDGIRRALRTLTQRLGELDMPVSPATQHTASHLLERLNQRERLRPTT